MSLRELRPHQVKALDGLKESMRAGLRRPMLQLPTGAGKTVVAAHIVVGARAKGNRVCFCVPSLGLIDQTFERFVENGIDPGDIGVIQADHPWRRPQAPIQIATAQTLNRREFPIADVVVIDEGHIRHAVYEKWMSDPAHEKMPFIGLSATPWSKGLGKQFNNLIKPISMAELIEQGYLSRYRCFAPSHPDLTGVKTVRGDYAEGELGDAMSKPKLVADIVATWLEKGENRPTLCFCVTRAHAQLVHDQFEANGVRSAYVDAFTPREERVKIGERLQAGEIQVVCNIGTLTTGIDWDVRCIILARPTKSEMLYVQIVGRGLRTAPGKNHCVARGSMILTDIGEVKIEDITLDHKLWDGVNFVSHAGAVCKGIHPVITHDGVTATAEHLVMTNEGWKTISEAHRLKLGIARTGIRGNAVRFFDDNIRQNRREELSSSRRSVVRQVREKAHDVVQQSTQKIVYESVSALQWKEAISCPKVALSSLPCPERQMLQPILSVLQGLWGAWDRIQIFWSKRSSSMDSGEYWYPFRQKVGNRQNRQRRSLRTWESAVGSQNCADEQSTAQWDEREVHLVPEKLSGNLLCGQDSAAHDLEWFDRCSDQGAVVRAFSQAQGEVWDIHNAGPLQRFTANGRLVHNCLILDHSDTALRLGMVDEIDHDELSLGAAGKAEDGEDDEAKEIALPTACVGCGCLIAPRVRECPQCGMVKKPRVTIQTEDGELVEMGSGGRAKAGKKQSVSDWLREQPKMQIWGEIRSLQSAHSWSDGRAAHTFREIYGVWPNGVRTAPMRDPSPELRSWVRSRAIAYAKAQKSNVA